jgi:SAM-dependent methyltransferase
MGRSIIEVRLEDISCPLGCKKEDEVVLTGHDLLHDLSGEFTIVKCISCGLMRTNPRPTPDTIGYYYPEDYGPYLGTQVRQAKHKGLTNIKKLIKPFVKSVINFKTTSLPPLKQGRMLEIGCASGAFLHHMAFQGWQVEGIEFSEKAAHAATKLGYRVHAGPLETAPQPDEPFDLIVGWMVLEHLHDPVGCLKKLREWAKQDAWLVLSVPNAASQSFRFFKSRWYDLHLPNHLYHFTPHTMELVLEASGWELVKVQHQRVLNNMIASTGYVLRDKGYAKLGQKLINLPVWAGRLSYILYPLAWLLSVFGQTGRMTIWARIK